MTNIQRYIATIINVSKDMSAINNVDTDHYISLRGKLIPGKVDGNLFHLLISIVGVKNEKMVFALRDVLVHGKSRKQACSEYNVSQSYFSIKHHQLQGVSVLMARAYIYYLCTDKYK
ncbi:PapB/FocB family fimbrial expression transcriptional regulator [Hafnia paralvei]|uniref:PapB/FocB family fimbrial expression transcriptional regulator n=1 Tax=Hafnia paralvei TaxID=546367 RepID=UPI0027BA6D33|nr:PapB/FocB family fimbrial expression transcriptional regulator [Hafnia paralvei]